MARKSNMNCVRYTFAVAVLAFAFSKGKLLSCCLRSKTRDKSVCKKEMIEKAGSQN